MEEKGESDGLKFCCVNKYKARELMFVNFEYIKNVYSLKERVGMCTRWKLSYDLNSFSGGLEVVVCE